MIPDADTQGGNKQFAFTSVISPDDTSLMQSVTVSENGSNEGGPNSDVPTNDTIEDVTGDPGATEINYLWGGGGADILNGGTGMDVLNGGDGIDELNGGAGNDLLVYDSTDSLIDGGSGMDILRIDIGHLEVTGSSTDLVGNTAIDNIEIILLTEDVNTDPLFGISLTLNASDVLNFTDAEDDLYILGTEGDSVSGDFTGWSVGQDALNIDGTLFDIYTNGGGATVWIDDEIDQTGITGPV